MTLTFNVREQMFQITLFLVKVKKLCQISLKDMHKCTSYGLEKSGWMHNVRTHKPCTSRTKRMHIHRTEVVPTMSRSLQAGSTEIKTAKEDFKENPSFDPSIILSIDTCRRFFLILYNITGHLLFCCHSNQWLMLQMIIYSVTDVRATFRHKNILYRHSSSS